MQLRGVATAASVIALAATSVSAEDGAARETRFALVADQLVVEGHKTERGVSSAAATKIETPLVDIPQSISVISEEFIDALAMRSMADVVRYTPGVSMGQGEGHRDAPTLRGNSTTADFYVDGVRDDLQYLRDLYNAQRIEVLRGPNALIFGRGGGGGVINRVTEVAHWDPAQEIQLHGGSFGYGRAAIDVGAAASDEIALRLNAVYENSDSYRDFVGLERYGINPTVALRLAPESTLVFSYERFKDERTVDRGVPSMNGLPFDGSRSAFFGNPDQSNSDVGVHLASAMLSHAFAQNLTLRNRTQFADYSKFYENVHANSPVGVGGDVSLQSYFSATERRNLFNQTDLILRVASGPLKHAILFGAEFGVQNTDNLRTANNNGAGVVNVASPTIFTPVAYSPVNTDNAVELKLAAVYLQDQIQIGDRIQVIGGLRFDHFNIAFDDLRPANADFSRTDNVVSPRAGVIFKPMAGASLYGSYAISFLPQSGDQFASLTATTAALEPERFENIEVGIKWDITPELALTLAAYRLDRENSTAIDPLTSTTVLTGEQRSKGVELGLSGVVLPGWQVQAGYALQDAEITRTTTAAPAGRAVPLVPRHAFSFWNRVDVTDFLGLGVGVIHQSEVFASISNAVVLPSFTRIDAALYLRLSDRLEAQMNVENLFDETYWGTAHNDNNITPGSPRAFRAGVTARL